MILHGDGSNSLSTRLTSLEMRLEELAEETAAEETAVEEAGTDDENDVSEPVNRQP